VKVRVVFLLLLGAACGGREDAGRQGERSTIWHDDADALVLAEPAYTRGLVALDAFDLDGAEFNFSQAIREFPRHAHAFYQRGLARLAREQYDAALEDFTRALDAEPGYTEPFDDRAWAYFLKGDGGSARLDAATAIRLNPGIVGWHTTVHRQLDTDDEVLAFLARAERDAFARTKRGNAWVAKRDHEKALAEYGAALAADPGFVLPWVARAQLRVALGRYREAVEDCAQAIRLEDRLGYAYELRGWALYALGRFADAGQDMGKALALGPESVRLHQRAGFVAFAQGREEEAMRAFTAANRWDPLQLFALDETRGVPAAAVAHFQTKTKESPGSAVAFFLLANARYAAQQNDGAIANFTKALDLAPSFALALVSRAKVWQVKGETSEAFKDFDRAVGLDPGSARAFNNRGTIHMEADRQREALADYEEAMRLAPRMWWAPSNMAEVWNKRKEYAKAVRLCTVAVHVGRESRPIAANAYRLRAEAYEGLGDPAAAARDRMLQNRGP